MSVSSVLAVEGCIVVVIDVLEAAVVVAVLDGGAVVWNRLDAANPGKCCNSVGLVEGMEHDLVQGCSSDGFWIVIVGTA